MSILQDNTSSAAMERLDSVVDRLCHPESLDKVWHCSARGMAMPSLDRLNEIMDRLRAALFPGYFGAARVWRESMRHHLAANLDSVYRLLAEQIQRGISFSCKGEGEGCQNCERNSRELALAFMDKLPDIRHKLAGDAQAGYEGDPAATSPGETIFCYPSMYTMVHHRIAHELYLMKVPMLPRMMTEYAHSLTGIDIHPGATVGPYFFIDHGTGVVIGETTVIGEHVKLYQGVTLGAKSFAVKADGTLVKGNKRHPNIGSNVVIYAGATILGGDTYIGDNCVIGGNVWLTHSVEPGKRVLTAREQTEFVTTDI